MMWVVGCGSCVTLCGVPRVEGRMWCTHAVYTRRAKLQCKGDRRAPCCVNLWHRAKLRSLRARQPETRVCVRILHVQRGERAKPNPCLAFAMSFSFLSPSNLLPCSVHSSLTLPLSHSPTLSNSPSTQPSTLHPPLYVHPLPSPHPFVRTQQGMRLRIRSSSNPPARAGSTSPWPTAASATRARRITASM